MHGYFSGYVVVGLLLALGLLFVVAGVTANRLLRPGPPGGETLTTYESGVDPVGTGWAQTHVRYYVFAFLYVIFAVESLYVFPWAAVLQLPGFGAPALGEMAVFVGFLAVGVLYAWRKGVLTWE